MRATPRSLPAFLAVLLAAAGCDHATKQVAIATLTGVQSVSLVGDAVRLELVTNPGAFLGLGAGLSEALRTALLLGFVPLLVLSVCAYLAFRQAPSRRLLAGLGLVAGGGLANWLDRILHDGAVTDFILLRLGPLHTGIFNVADVAVVLGVGLLLASNRKTRPRPA